MQLLPQIWNRRSRWIVPLFIAGLGSLVLLAQPPLRGQSAPGSQSSTFSTGVNLVEVYATVTDRAGQPVTDLTAADFGVIEDSVPQTITTFTAGEFPLSVAIALDRSFSMAGERLALSKQAARTFIAALRPTDEVMVLAIGSEIDTVTPPVSARDAGATRWEAIGAWGTTLLYDATAQALDAVAARSGRRALLVISDGVDRDSLTTATDLIARARESNVLVYPIAIGGARPPVFAELANVTGGRTLFIEDPKRLESQLATLARELRFQYLLGYTPSPRASGPGEVSNGAPGAAATPGAGTPSGAPEWRAIEVTVSRPDVRVRARDGYFAR
jgi:Ca-activated chloride channel family protein